MTYRLLYMGTPDFAVPALRALHEAGHEIAAVYTQPPRPAGRGKKLQQSPVHQCALELGLPVEHPVNFKSDEARATLKAYDAELAVVAAYGLILPQAVLDLVPLGFLNIHGSLLPRWRGAAPLHRAIEAGDDETGITIMQMEAGLDTGPMSLKDSLSIDDKATAGTLHDGLAAMGARLITQALSDLDAGNLRFEPQTDNLATYAHKILKQEAALDFSALTAAQTLRKIHALSPFPGAYVMLEGKRVKLLQVQTAQGSGTPGETLDDALTIACARGAIQPTLLQPAGKGAMTLEAFLRGRSVPKGTDLRA